MDIHGSISFDAHAPKLPNVVSTLLKLTVQVDDVGDFSAIIFAVDRAEKVIKIFDKTLAEER